MHVNSALSLAGAKVLSKTANLAWALTKAVTRFVPEGELPEPDWAPRRLLKSGERSLPPLGVPRTTDSLCPRCAVQIRDAILRGQEDLRRLKNGAGVIRADIVEEGGRVLMRKVCDRHGPFEDLLATSADFFRRMESLYPGRDFDCTEAHEVHDHGTDSLRYGRGSLLVFDLTNRCNMMCTPCFMDANHVGHVHELQPDDIRTILERALSFKPRRDINILFSGGEPTVSRHFLDAIRCAKSMGFHRLHVATNGIRFAENEEFAEQAREAGLHAVYLQLDGVSEEKNSHRGVGNLFEVKVRAIENIARARMRIYLQSTVIRGLNNDTVGSIVDFAVRNSDKIAGVLFQPIMFCGRDEEVDDETRYGQRYTLSQLAEDLQVQSSIDWQPLRDWFPFAFFDVFSTVMDSSRPNAAMGSITVNHHPDTSVASPMVVNRRTGVWAPLASFFDLEQFVRDLTVVADSACGNVLTRAQMSLSLLRNYKPSQAPAGFTVRDLFALVEQTATCYDSSSLDWSEKASRDHMWSLFVIRGMWFQDLFNYDLRNIEMSSTPVATQKGEIPFSAYNAAGWRQIVEHEHQTGTLSQWHKQQGRHTIYAGGQKVLLDSNPSLVQISSARQYSAPSRETSAETEEVLAQTKEVLK